MQITIETRLSSGSAYLPPFTYYSLLFMKDFAVSVRKLTDDELMREACECTFIGKSHQSLLSIYKSEHSPARTQIFWIKLTSIPLFIATHLIRHHVGTVPFQLTCREDREGGNPGFINLVESINNQLSTLISLTQGGNNSETQLFIIESVIHQLEWLKENADRYTPVDLGLCLNAQSLIDMAKVRLCTGCAHPETVKVFKAMKNEIAKVDHDLASVMVRKCVYRNGLCGEPKCCGFNLTKAFTAELREYLKLFNDKQKGLIK